MLGKLLKLGKKEKRTLVSCPQCGCALGNGVIESRNGVAHVIGYCPRHGYVQSRLVRTDGRSEKQ